MGLSLSANPNNTSTVDPSHGQGGYGMGPGANGGKISTLSNGPGAHNFGGYTDWYRATNATPPTYKDPQTGQLMASYNPNRRQIQGGGSQFENRKGNSPDLLRQIYIDNPHGSGGWI